MKPDKRGVLITGFGIVAQALLPMLEQRAGVRADEVTVIDFADRRRRLRPWIKRGLCFVRERVTPLNLSRLLSTHIGEGGLIIDLAWSIDCFDMLHWAHHHGVRYVNASVEAWDPVGEIHTQSLYEKSLYSRYVRLLGLVNEWQNGPTAVIDHGANPGLVSHFVKQGLIDIARAALKEGGLAGAKRREVQDCLEARYFAGLARALDVKAIHCSEWDSQRAPVPKRPDEFVGTWSVEGMWEESISPCELGWGTHEQILPPFAAVPDSGPRNQIILPRMGLNTMARSWVPGREIVGMIVTHGESFGVSHALTVREGGVPVYRPTVHYAYMPCNDSLVSLHELRCRNYELHPRRRIMANEISTGMDLVGALLMGHPFRSWWTGSILSIAQARRAVPDVNATAVQVAAGVLAAVLWAERNPRRGFCFPEDLPHEEVLRDARPYLGRVVSLRSDWTPLQRHRVYFGENPEACPDHLDPWQFRNFLFSP
jgi:homospermidine synthase